MTEYSYDGQDRVITKKISHRRDSMEIEVFDEITYDYVAALGITLISKVSNKYVVQSFKYQSQLGENVGLLVQKNSPSIPIVYGFTGREFDPETGFYYYRGRYYDPETGRFLTKDPIGLAGGDTNLYRYVGNNPVNYTDPTGKNPLLIPVGIGAVVGGAATVSAAIAVNSAIGLSANVASQTLVSGRSLGEINLTEVGISGVIGGIAGGLGAAAGNLVPQFWAMPLVRVVLR